MSRKFFNNDFYNTIVDEHEGIVSEMVDFEIDTNNILSGLQNMCNSVLVLYDAHAKKVSGVSEICKKVNKK